MQRLNRFLLPSLLIGLVIGCQNKPSPKSGKSATAGAATKPSTEGAKYILDKEPEGGKGVLATRETAKDGDDVIVVGRIGGSKKPIIPGRATFTIVDPVIKPCSENGDDNCPTPWDYCCGCTREELSQATATIKFINEKGNTVELDVKGDLAVHELQTVTIRGKAKREKGNLVVLASAMYVKPESKP